MVGVIGGRIASCFYNCCGWRNSTFVSSLCVGVSEVFQVRNYAARKGTREKAKKKKIKVEVKKVEFIPHSLRKKKTDRIITRRIDDSFKPESPDNVWISKNYKWPVYSFMEAVKCHRESHHPTVYNSPNAKLFVNLELDMRAAKMNRYLDDFSRLISVPHPFDTELVRSVLVFCKTPELQKSALEAGATVAGDTELIKNVQAGDLSLDDFQFVIAHPNILPELVSVRGLMKRKFPSQKSGTLGEDIPGMVNKYCNGIEYSAKQQMYMQEFGWIFTAIGRLDMDVSHLEANFSALLKDVNSKRPQREGPFITKCCLVSVPSPERLKIDHTQYTDDDEVDGKMNEENEDTDDETEKSEEKKTSAVAG